MSWTEKEATAADPWHQLEKLVDRMHELARSPIAVAEFYRQLLDGCVTMLAADGGAVWQRTDTGRWTTLHQIRLAATLGAEGTEGNDTSNAHEELLDRLAKHEEVILLPPESGGDDGLENPTRATILAGSVPAESGSTVVIELLLPPGCSPDVQQGWQELLETVRQIAADYHAWDDYRRLRAEQTFHSHSLALLRRVHGRADLRATAFEVANEGCRLLEADRLSVLVRRGKRWQLLAVSGADHVDPRADTAKSLRNIAEWSARWGDPIDYMENESLNDLPDSLAELMAAHVDQSQARRVVAVPLEFTAPESELNRNNRKKSPTAVLIAEQFQSEAESLSRERIVELAHLCQPALQQAMRLDRFGLRGILRWSDRLAEAGWLRSLSKTLVIGGVIAALIAALVLVETDFEIEASARLVPLVEQDIFAAADGTVRTIHIEHGDTVETGDLLATLDDPQLVLDLQRVRGEIDTTHKRLEAIAVARTDRQVRENEQKESLTLSAEAEQLQQKLQSLERQEEILLGRQQALEIRSPIAGTILTLDVQDLLATRPVARGQVLFTVADSSAGWKLMADVPQDRIGHVLEAAANSNEDLGIRYRISGDVDHTYNGQLAEIKEVAVLDTTDLGQEQPAIQAEISLIDDVPAAARPGMTAEVRIHCGQRSLGYVWLHDVWETVYRWVVF